MFAGLCCLALSPLYRKERPWARSGNRLPFSPVMKMKEDLCAKLILFTRYPEPGRAKTRLIPVLGPEGAADLQRRMTERLVAQLLLFAEEYPVATEIRYDGGTPELVVDWLGHDLPALPQGEGGLGERLERAAVAAFADGVARLVFIGADCPALTPPLFARAFAALLRHDLVLGPAADGGYYLIGLRCPWAGLFRDIPWGSGEVLAVTLGRARGLGLSIHLLEQHADVDRPEDLRYFHHHPNLR